MKENRNLVAVAAALMAEPGGRHYGYPLSRRAGVRSGVMYPVLRQMLEDGVLDDGWEEPGEAGRGKRPRRYYTLTETGRARLDEVLGRARSDPRYARILGRVQAPRPRRGWGVTTARRVQRG